MKKVISLVMALCMLVSVFSVSAAYYAPETMPEVGVLISDDMSYSSRAEAIAGGTTWHDWTYGTFTGSAYKCENTYFSHDLRALGMTEDLASGIFKVQYDVNIPAESTGGYMTLGTYSDDAWRNSKTDGRIYHSSARIENGVAAISFGGSNGGAPGMTNDAQGNPENYKVVERDTWYTITNIIDFNKKTSYGYVDGEYIYKYLGSEEYFDLHFPLSWVVVTAGGNSNILVDNLLVERLGSDDVTAKVSEVGANYADIKFDTTVVKNDTYTASNFLLKKLDGSAAVSASSVTKLSIDTFRVTFADNFASGANYEIIVNADVAEAGTESIMPKGTKLLFVTPSDASTNALIDIDFNDNDNHYMTDANKETFNKYYYQAESASVTDNDFVSQQDLIPTYISRTSRGDGETGRNWKIFQLYHPSAAPEHQSVVFPFDNGADIDNGKITIEFDAMMEGTTDTGGAFETAYGLRDTKNTATAFDYKNTWANSTVFAGHHTWSGKTRDLTPSLESKRGKPVTWYNGNGNTGVVDGTAASDWNDKYRLVTTNYTNMNNHTEMEQYKIVVDLDNDFFEIWYNGSLKYTSTYMPGGINDGSYDAFVLTTVHRPGSAHNWFYLDNLKVTHEAPEAEAFAVEGAAFDIDGKTVAYGSAVDFTANKMTITMSEEVSAAGVENYVEFSGSDDYTVSADGNVITLDFANGLTYGQDYTVTLSSELAAASGTKLGQDIVLSFEAVVGDITYGTPVVALGEYTLTNPSAVQANDTLTVTVNAKAGVSCSATIILAAYSNGQLADVAQQTVTSDSGVLEFVYTASEKFAGAEVVKAFVFDNLTSITPLAANFSAGE